MSRQNKNTKVKRFRLSLINDETHQQLWTLKYNRPSFIIAILTILVTFCLIIYSIIAYTPIKTFIPGYPNANTKSIAIKNMLIIDSLETQMAKWEIYSENVKRVLNNVEPLKIDSLIKEQNRQTERGNILNLRKQDSLLRKNVHNAEQFAINNTKVRGLQIEGMHFFTPLKGVISQGYDKIIHPYIDITAPANSMVKATLDGTVIFAGWNEESGYTIQIQHDNDIISIYKHNEKLLKKIGDKVKAGTPIALIGSTGKISNGVHLHFELWYKGEAVDPTEYISF